jgi:KDO2-lipid IV(A) lauroyltransferase
VRRSKQVRHVLELGAFRFAVWCMERLPAAPAVAFAQSLGSLAWVCDRHHRRIACENIIKAGVAPDEATARQIGRAAMRHVGAVMVESWRMAPGLASGRWQDHIEFEMPSETRAVLEDPGRGVIVVSAHLGNWELGACLVALMKPLLVVVRKLNNPYVDRLVAERSHRNRMRTILKDQASGRALLAAIRKGEGVALLVDQHARKGGIMVDFLGHPASTYASPGRLQLASAAPIVACTLIRTGLLHYRFVFSHPMLRPEGVDREEVVHRVTEAINNQLGEWIRRNPEQYLWFHRRWR